MLAGKLGGVQAVHQVKDRRFDPSESFGEATEIWTVGLGHHVQVLDHWSAHPVYQVEVLVCQPLLIRGVCFSFFTLVGKRFRRSTDRPGPPSFMLLSCGGAANRSACLI